MVLWLFKNGKVNPFDNFGNLPTQVPQLCRNYSFGPCDVLSINQTDPFYSLNPAAKAHFPFLFTQPKTTAHPGLLINQGQTVKTPTPAFSPSSSPPHPATCSPPHPLHLDSTSQPTPTHPYSSIPPSPPQLMHPHLILFKLQKSQPDHHSSPKS